MTAAKSKTTAARLTDCLRAAQEAGQTVAKARVEGRAIVLEFATQARDSVNPADLIDP